MGWRLPVESEWAQLVAGGPHRRDPQRMPSAAAITHHGAAIITITHHLGSRGPDLQARWSGQALLGQGGLPATTALVEGAWPGHVRPDGQDVLWPGPRQGEPVVRAA